MYQINTLYTINLYNVICQLYLNKLEKGRKERKGRRDGGREGGNLVIEKKEGFCMLRE